MCLSYCTVCEIGVLNVNVPLKSGLGVIKGHLKLHRSIDRIQVLIGVSQ